MMIRMMAIPMMTMRNIPKVGGAVEQEAPIFPINLYLPRTLPLHCTVFYCTNTNTKHNKYKQGIIQNTINLYLPGTLPFNCTLIHCTKVHQKDTTDATAALYYMTVTLASSSAAQWTVFHCTKRLYLHHPLHCTQYSTVMHRSIIQGIEISIP